MAPQSTNTDEDRFQLGMLNTGNVIDLGLRLPSSSSLIPSLRVFDGSGVELLDTDGDPTNAYRQYWRLNAHAYAPMYAPHAMGYPGLRSSDITAPAIRPWVSSTGMASVAPASWGSYPATPTVRSWRCGPTWMLFRSKKKPVWIMLRRIPV